MPTSSSSKSAPGTPAAARRRIRRSLRPAAAARSRATRAGARHHRGAAQRAETEEAPSVGARSRLSPVRIPAAATRPRIASSAHPRTPLPPVASRSRRGDRAPPCGPADPTVGRRCGRADSARTRWRSRAPGEREPTTTCAARSRWRRRCGPRSSAPSLPWRPASTSNSGRSTIDAATTRSRMAQGRVFNPCSIRRPTPRPGAGSRGRRPRGETGRENPVLRGPEDEEEKQAARTQREGDHRRDSQDVEHARQRPSRRAQLHHEHRRRRGEQHDRGAGADLVLRRDQPGGNRPTDRPSGPDRRPLRPGCPPGTPERRRRRARRDDPSSACASRRRGRRARGRARARRSAGRRSDRSRRRSRGSRAPPAAPRGSTAAPRPAAEGRRSTPAVTSSGSTTNRTGWVRRSGR